MDSGAKDAPGPVQLAFLEAGGNGRLAGLFDTLFQLGPGGAERLPGSQPGRLSEAPVGRKPLDGEEAGGAVTVGNQVPPAGLRGKAVRVNY